MRKLIKEIRCETERINRKREIMGDDDWSWDEKIILDLLNEVVRRFDVIENKVKDNIQYRNFDMPMVDTHGNCEFRAWMKVNAGKSLNVFNEAVTIPVREEIKEELAEKVLDYIFNAEDSDE